MLQSVLVRSASRQEALGLLAGTRSVGVLPSDINYNAAISACEKCYNTTPWLAKPRGEHVFQQMHGCCDSAAWPAVSHFFGEHFNQSLNGMMLPSGLQSLTFGRGVALTRMGRHVYLAFLG